MEAVALSGRFLNAAASPTCNRNHPISHLLPLPRSARCRPHQAAGPLSVRCLHTPNPTPPAPRPCSAVAYDRAAPPTPAGHRLGLLVDEFRSLPESLDRVKRLLVCASSLPAFPESDRIPANRVMGCTAQVWVSVAMDGLGRMRFAADSDSEITKGFSACLISVLDGALPEEVLGMTPEDFGDLNVVGLSVRAPSRVNTWHNLLISMQKRTKALIAKEEGRPPVDPFPSLIIGADGIEAKGSYAEAQQKGKQDSDKQGKSSDRAPAFFPQGQSE